VVTRPSGDEKGLWQEGSGGGENDRPMTGKRHSDEKSWRENQTEARIKSVWLRGIGIIVEPFHATHIPDPSLVTVCATVFVFGVLELVLIGLHIMK
jgi:hypothetical protein